MDYYMEPVDVTEWESLVVNEMPRDNAGFGERIIVPSKGFMGNEAQMAIALGATPINRNPIPNARIRAAFDYIPVTMGEIDGDLGRHVHRKSKRVFKKGMVRQGVAPIFGYGEYVADMGRVSIGQQQRLSVEKRKALQKKQYAIKKQRMIKANQKRQFIPTSKLNGEDMGSIWGDIKKGVKKAGKAVSKGTKAVVKQVKAAPKAIVKQVKAAPKALVKATKATVLAPIKLTKFAAKSTGQVAKAVKKEVVSARKGLQTDARYLKKEIKGAKKSLKTEAKGAMRLTKDIAMAPVGIAKAAGQVAEMATKGVVKTAQAVAASGGRGLQTVVGGAGQMLVTGATQAAQTANVAGRQARVFAQRAGDVAYQTVKIPTVLPLQMTQQFAKRAGADIQSVFARPKPAPRPAPRPAPLPPQALPGLVESSDTYPQEEVYEEAYPQEEVYEEAYPQEAYPQEASYPGEQAVPQTEWDYPSETVYDQQPQIVSNAASYEDSVYAPSGGAVAPQNQYQYQQSSWQEEEPYQPQYQQPQYQEPQYQQQYQEPQYQQPQYQELSYDPYAASSGDQYVDEYFPEAQSVNASDEWSSQLFGLGAIIDNEIDQNRRQTAAVLNALSETIWPEQKLQLAQQKTELQMKAADLVKAKAVIMQANGGIDPLIKQQLSQPIQSDYMMFEEIIPTGEEFYPYQIARFRDGSMGDMGFSWNPIKRLKKMARKVAYGVKNPGKAFSKGLKKVKYGVKNPMKATIKHTKKMLGEYDGYGDMGFSLDPRKAIKKGIRKAKYGIKNPKRAFKKVAHIGEYDGYGDMGFSLDPRKAIKKGIRKAKYGIKNPKRAFKKVAHISGLGECGDYGYYGECGDMGFSNPFKTVKNIVKGVKAAKSVAKNIKKAKHSHKRALRRSSLKGYEGFGANPILDAAMQSVSKAGVSALQQQVLQNPELQAQLNKMAAEAGEKAAGSAKTQIQSIYEANKGSIIGWGVGGILFLGFLGYTMLKPRTIKVRLAELQGQEGAK
jgi:hypothetical protein